MQISDGRTGNTVTIGVNNRMLVSSISESIEDYATELGDRFNLNTGDLTLTDANKTSVLYVKNNENEDLVITSLIYNLGNSTSGTGDVLIEILRNPTAGDIVTNANATAVTPATVAANQNFGSNVTLSVNAYKGATSEGVFSDGTVSISTRSAANTGRILIAIGAIVLPKGSSLGIDYTPPASNSSQKCQFALSCYLRTSAVRAVT